MAEEFDAILFYECFHHASDHMRLLGSLAKRLRPGGQLVLASEPIWDGFPMPWGLRLDGNSLWAIRNFGWLELGYTESYFREALARTGWSVRKHSYPVTDLGTIYVAGRA
jgi:SAM-dependent methyltransferase